MICNECEKVDPCVSEPCDCVQKDMSTDCSVYTGDDLECSGIEQNTILTKVIQSLDTFICNKFNEAVKYLTLANVGGGAEIYKGISGIGNKEIRSLVTGDATLMDVVEEVDTIEIKPGTPSLSLNSTTDVVSLIVTTLGGATTFSTIDLSEYNYNTFVQSASFNTTTKLITITRNNGEANIVVDLGFLDNHLESSSYTALSNTVDFTLTDASTIQLDLSTLVNEILTAAATANLQADVLETNGSSKAFINNKNATKSVILGVAGNYNVANGDNNYSIEIDNGANDVTIDFVNITDTDNFFVGFVQKGTGLVTFNNADIIPQDTTNVLYGQGHVASIQVVNSTKYLNGNLKTS